MFHQILNKMNNKIDLLQEAWKTNRQYKSVISWILVCIFSTSVVLGLHQTFSVAKAQSIDEIFRDRPTEPSIPPTRPPNENTSINIRASASLSNSNGYVDVYPSEEETEYPTFYIDIRDGASGINAERFLYEIVYTPSETRTSLRINGNLVHQHLPDPTGSVQQAELTDEDFRLLMESWGAIYQGLVFAFEFPDSPLAGGMSIVNEIAGRVTYYADVVVDEIGAIPVPGADGLRWPQDVPGWDDDDDDDPSPPGRPFTDIDDFAAERLPVYQDVSVEQCIWDRTTGDTCRERSRVINNRTFTIENQTPLASWFPFFDPEAYSSREECLDAVDALIDTYSGIGASEIVGGACIGLLQGGAWLAGGVLGRSGLVAALSRQAAKSLATNIGLGATCSLAYSGAASLIAPAIKAKLREECRQAFPDNGGTSQPPTVALRPKDTLVCPSAA